MAASLRTVAVVGASLAGLRAAEALRQEGFDGRVVLIGDEPHLPYDRPPLSKQLLAGEWGLEQIALRDAERYDKLDLDWRLGTRAARLDLGARKVVLQGGDTVSFDRAVLATGASPRRLRGTDGPGAEDLDNVFTLRTIEDSLALSAVLAERGARIVVVGAGFIGSEVAATAHSRGAEVTVVEALPTPLGRVLGEEMGRACGALHTDHGVTLRCGTGVEAIDGAGSPGARRTRSVRLTDGTTIDADAVVVGIGVSPNTAWLDGSGLRLADGVLCDAGCFAAEGVVAAGDVSRWHHAGLGIDLRVEHWTNATEQAAVAARNLLVGPRGATAYEPVPYFWSDQYESKIQYVGHGHPDDEVRVVDGAVSDRRFVAIYGRGGRLTAALGFNRPRQLMAYRRLLAHCASFETAIRHGEEAGMPRVDGA